MSMAFAEQRRWVQLGWVCALSVALGSGFWGVGSASAAVSSERAVGFLNQQRAANGIPGDLVNRPDWADGCAKHNRYQSLTEDWGHEENPASPHYTREGDQAAQSSVLSFSGGYSAAGDNPWEWAPIHLYIMLKPGLTAAGYDHSGSFACMRMYGAPERSEPLFPQFYSYPGPGTTGIYPDEYAAEWPYTPQQLVGISEGAVTGTNILLFSLGTRGLDAASFSLVGPAGPVAARMVDENTQNEVGNGSWFAGGGVMVPEQPLAKHTTYSVSVTWRNLAFGQSQGGEEEGEESDPLAGVEFFEQKFSFTTGALSQRGRENLHRPTPDLRLRRVGQAGRFMRLRLTADSALRGRRAQLVVYRHERGCGRLFASSHGPCGWRQLGRPKKRFLSLRGSQLLKLGKPLRWQKATIKVRTRSFKNGETRYRPALAKLVVRGD